MREGEQDDMSILDRPTAASIALRRDAQCPHSVLLIVPC